MRVFPVSLCSLSNQDYVGSGKEGNQEMCTRSVSNSHWQKDRLAVSGGSQVLLSFTASVAVGPPVSRNTPRPWWVV